MMSPKQYGLLGAGVLVAAWAATTSFVIANQARAPQKSLLVGLPPQHYAEAQMARTIYKGRLVRDAAAYPAKPERRLALEGFAGEPLAAIGLPVLVKALAADGKAGESEQLLQLAGKLTRRDVLLNALQIESELKHNRPERLIRLFGRAMAVNYEVRSFYMDQMANATANPAAIQGLAPMLGEKPDWAQAYWNAVLERPAILPQAARLRERLAGAPWNRKTPSDVDVDLVGRLASLRNPQAAYDLARALGMRAPAQGNLLLNGSFDQKAQFVPFDWEMIQSGDVGASIDPKAGAMLVSALPSADGIVFRQLVRLQPGAHYRLGWKMTGLSQSPGAVLRFRLSCAEAKGFGASMAMVGLSEGAMSKDFTLDPSACRWLWATVEFDTAQSDAGIDAAFQQITLSPASGTDSRPLAKAVLPR